MSRTPSTASVRRRTAATTTRRTSRRRSSGWSRASCLAGGSGWASAGSAHGRSPIVIPSRSFPSEAGFGPTCKLRNRTSPAPWRSWAFRLGSATDLSSHSSWAWSTPTARCTGTCPSRSGVERWRLRSSPWRGTASCCSRGRKRPAPRELQRSAGVLWAAGAHFRPWCRLSEWATICGGSAQPIACRCEVDPTSWAGSSAGLSTPSATRG